MRSFFAAAFVLIAGGAAQAQYYSLQAQYYSFENGGDQPIEVIVNPRCAGPNCVYVRVPGQVDVGAPPSGYVSPRYAPPSPYGGPPSLSGLSATAFAWIRAADGLCAAARISAAGILRRRR